MTETNPLAPPTSRTITLEDVHRLIGGYVIELEMLRRENAQLRAALETAGQANNDRKVPKVLEGGVRP
jgi:hypothetical protein